MIPSNFREVAIIALPLPPGALDENLNLICGINALKITKIKPDGSRLMDFKDFVNGRQTRPGDRFMKIDNENRDS